MKRPSIVRAAAAFAAVVFATAARAGGGPALPVLTLDEAVSIALARNRGVATASLAVAAASESLDAARTRRLPTVSLEANAIHNFTDESYTIHRGELGSFDATGPIPATDVRLHTARDVSGLVEVKAALPLTQQYRIGLGIASGELGVTTAEESLRARRQQVANDVKEAYHRLVATESARAAAEEAVTYLRGLLELAERYERERTVLPYEVMDARARLADAARDVLVLRNALASQREALNQLLGRDLGIDFAVVTPTVAADTAIDAAAAASRALAQRPELRMAELGVRRADYDVESKRSEFIPDVSWVVSYSRPVGIDFVPEQTAYAGLHLEWDVWDWGRRGHELAERDHTLAQARAEAEDTRASVLRELNAALRGRDEARAEVHAAQLSLDAAREKRRSTFDRFRHEASLLTDALEAEAAVARAVGDHAQALTDLWTADARLARAMGED